MASKTSKFKSQSAGRTTTTTRRDLIATSAATAGALLLPNPAESLPPTSYLLPPSSTLLLPAAAVGDDAALPAGVTPEWDVSRAYSEKSPTRERISLNGLWRWQPADARADAPPAAAWGWFKAPGCWPGITDYMQKDCQTVFPHGAWKNVNMRGVALAWYQREITIPAAWKGRRIGLSLEYVNTFATVCIGGKAVGEIKFPAGSLDLSGHVQPGGKYQLSIFVQAAPLKAVMLSYTDTNGAREVKGSVERRGLCGDVWLTSEPQAARIADVKINTSVEKGEIQYDVAFEALSPGVAYSLKTSIENDSAGYRGGTHTFTAADLKSGRRLFTESWKPDKLWDIHTPQNKHSVVISLNAGARVVDQTPAITFGFRELVIKGKDFYLNGSRIYLPALPLDNAQVGAAWASYEGARETLERFKSMGMYFLYTHNYSCEPGVHLSFGEILRAADDVGMLIALAQPHFSNYDWKAADADDNNGYAKHAEWYVRVAQNHPCVVAYAMSHNATGYVEEANPDMIDGIQDPREDWGRRNSLLALRAEAIVKRFDTSRIVYHHSSGNLSSMHTCNFYVNLVPPQELCDWFEHWEKSGVKPLFLCEYGVPCTWDWTMYRGWYKGKREWGGAVVPWEFCLAEWDAQFVGEAAYKITDRERRNIVWEAQRFKNGELWHRWDYPTQVGSDTFDDRNAAFSRYMTDNWRAYRTRGVSAFGPWEYEMYWSLKGNAERNRKQLPVDWQNLQRPGFSADYIEDRPNNIAIGFERSDWMPTTAGAAFLRNNRPLLAYIAGPETAVTSKDHIYNPGEIVRKQIVVINNSRVSAECECTWSFGNGGHNLGGTQTVRIPTGDQARIPIDFKLEDDLHEGEGRIEASVRFNGSELQKDSFAIHVRPSAAELKSVRRYALFDPVGETAKLLNTANILRVEAGDDLSAFDVLIIGKAALTVDGAAPDISRVRDGLKVVVMEQTPEVLEHRFGFRTAAYGLRQVFRRMPDHPCLAGIAPEHLADWRGEATILPSRLKYTIGERYSPQVKWCGIDVTRVWRCGCRGNVASALIEKPAAGDFTPVVDGGYGLQYAALMVYREGKGMVLFCQLDVTGRTQREPAADQILRNILGYVGEWKPQPTREVVYIGEDAGLAHFEAAGFAPRRPGAAGLPQAALLIAGPNCGTEAAGLHVDGHIRAGGRLLAIGLDEMQARELTGLEIQMAAAEHVAAHFEAPGFHSWLAGVCPAEIHNRDPRKIPLVTGGAQSVGAGVLANAGSNVTFCQLVPWQFAQSPMNQKRTFRHVAFLASRLAANLSGGSRTKLLHHVTTAARADEKRWLDGLYLDTPEEWDDPYRFFGW